jgi:DNA mismatch repair protein MutL
MARIRELPLSVVTKIAAGEVIERPASVVKELLENSIDAGSSRIDVAVEQGGSELIRVVDDGGGILPDDLPLVFANHATSKLADTEDLFRVGSLGFRGEAMASIGSVAQVLLQSRMPDRPSGAEMGCHGGELSAVRPWNGSPGTRVEVRHLFYNTPVRRKFLKSVGTEIGHISEILVKVALAQPGLQLSLQHNEKLVYEVPAATKLFDRLGLFFGEDVRNSLYALEARQGPVSLRGFIADPACERSTAKLQYLFVNGRWIRDRSLAHALQEAYRGLVMVGRYAVGFLFLEMPPDQLDVNVHPTKAEVRFRDPQALHHLVFAAVRDRLRAENLTARLKVPVPASGLWTGNGDGNGHGYVVSAQNAAPETGQLDLLTAAEMVAERSPVLQEEERFAPEPVAAVSVTEPAVAPPEPVAAMPIKALQVYNAYLVVEAEEGLLVIDQHALHERILFEQLKDRLRQGPLEMQRLLVPEPIELPAESLARVLEQREPLAELGLEIESFGGRTILLTSYPAILGKQSPHAIFEAVLTHVVSKECAPTREQLLNDLLSVMACRAAVKAGDPLSPEKIAALAAQRGLAQDTHHCPHGRPTALVFSRRELDRQFRRI